jgi:hypothetical protein
VKEKKRCGRSHSLATKSGGNLHIIEQNAICIKPCRDHACLATGLSLAAEMRCQIVVANNTSWLV